MVASHADAIGYLNDLGATEAKAWFTKLCDAVIYQGISNLTIEHLEELTSIYAKEADYIRPKDLEATIHNIETGVLADRLESLSNFVNFKGLKETLEVTFPVGKRITVIFGTNGSGKSSLCESLRLLGSPEEPARPLNNVKQKQEVPPGFEYKLRSSENTHKWTHLSGYGAHVGAVKFFDTSVAAKSISNHVEPGKVVKLSPFRLYLFESVRSALLQFRSHLESLHHSSTGDLDTTVTRIRELFSVFPNSALAGVNIEGIDSVSNELRVGGESDFRDVLQPLKAELELLRESSSTDEPTLLIARKEDLQQLIASGEQLVLASKNLWGMHCAEKTKELVEKKSAQTLLIEHITPMNITDDQFRALLKSASVIFAFDHPNDQNCPLCRQSLNEASIILFRRYHEFLVGEVETDIEILQAELKRATSYIETISEIAGLDPLQRVTVSLELRLEFSRLAANVASDCSLTTVPSAKALEAGERIGQLLQELRRQVETIEELHEFKIKGQLEQSQILEAKDRECRRLEYAEHVELHKETLKKLLTIKAKELYWSDAVASFSGLLSRVTRKSTLAHYELMVTDFTDCLQREYKALTEKSMEDFGVVLTKRGAEASVQIRPKVGNEVIGVVLSEGELRMHALVLFIAELENSAHSVIVLDDPITSFDYDYISNFCNRIRDFSLKHPERQVVILTHNWEFFVNIQTVLNKGLLGSHTSIQILENCAICMSYKDKPADLKLEIHSILSLPLEPTQKQKQEMAGSMRRLLESIVNKLVFNDQRHQYKQKSQAVSDFQKFTKLVPLEDEEAVELADLYSKLSVPEHDDPRNQFVGADKAMFRTRYDKILEIEAALLARKGS